MLLVSPAVVIDAPRCFASRDLMRRSAARPAGAASPSRRRRRRSARSTGSRSSCGSSARTRPRPETPFGIRARLKPAGKRARFEIATRTLSSSQSRTQPIGPSPGGVRAVLDGVGEQFVQGQRDRDRLDLRQGPSRGAVAGDAAADRPAEGSLHRAGDRLHHADDRERPVGADLQSVDLGDRLHLADDLVDRRRRPRASARRSAGADRRRPCRLFLMR